MTGRSYIWKLQRQAKARKKEKTERKDTMNETKEEWRKGKEDKKDSNRRKWRDEGN